MASSADIIAARPLDAIDAPILLVPPKAPLTTVIALSIATEVPPPAIVAVRYEPRLLTPGDPLMGEAPVFETLYRVFGAIALPPGESYPALALRLNRLTKRLWNQDSSGDYHVLIDTAEAGRPVVDAVRGVILKEAHVTAVRLTTAGDGGDLSLLWRNAAAVSLEYLTARLRAILQGRRLTLPADVPDLASGLRDMTAGSILSPLMRALALALASEYRAVTYDVSADELPDAIL